MLRDMGERRATDRRFMTGLGVALVVILGLLLYLQRDGGQRAGGPTTAQPSASAAAPSSQAKPPRALHVRDRGEQRIDLSETRTTEAEGIGRIEGRVLSRSTEEGVARAQLLFDDGTLHEVRTDAAGRFSFSPPKAGVYELALVTAEGFLPFAPEYGHSPMLFTAREGAGLSGAQVFLTPAIDYVVRVVSPGDDPQPVSNASVVALGGGARGATLVEEQRSWRTDEKGEAIVHAHDGTIFEATHPDHAPGRAELDFSAQVSHRLTIQLRSPEDAPATDAHISGTVMADGQPLADALVVATHAPDNPAKPSLLIPTQRMTTDETGKFSFSGLVAGGYHLSATAPGFAPVTKRDVAAPSDDVELVLERGASLFGEVTDTETGEPVPSFAVVVRERLGPLQLEVVVSEPTFDPDGAYSIPALPKGTFVVTVHAYGFATTPEREVVIGDVDVQADFALTRGATIAGSVIDADTKQPLEAAKVSLEGMYGGERSVQLSATSRTDARGRFELRGVPLGVQSILVAAAHHHGKLTNITAKAGVTHELTIALSPTEEGEAPRLELAGIGAVLSAKDDVLLIGRVIEGGGAAEAGLGPDDAITAVDGVPVVDLGFAGSIRKIRGPIGSKVLLTVRRAGEETPSPIEVFRRKIRS